MGKILAMDWSDNINVYRRKKCMAINFEQIKLKEILKYWCNIRTIIQQ